MVVLYFVVLGIGLVATVIGTIVSIFVEADSYARDRDWWVPVKVFSVGLTGSLLWPLSLPALIVVGLLKTVKDGGIKKKTED